MKYFLLLTLIFATTISFAKQIPLNEAETTAKNVYFEKSGILQSQIVFENIYTQTSKNQAVYYIFNIKGNNGFVIISADDLYAPIIAYSLKGNFKVNNMPENVSSWMNSYSNKINYLQENKPVQTPEIETLWNKYNTSVSNFSATKNTTMVPSMTDYIEFNQGTGWNQFCPEDENGQSLVGCVATAMSIIMKYWEYPTSGNGSTSYYAYPYGTLSVNFAESNYFWNQMENTSPTPAAAYLSYHAGVSVHMNYSVDGSGAYVGYGNYNARNALVNNFNFSNTANFKEKSDYSESTWINMLKADIDAGKPALYRGSGDEGGHAFVCDGYNGDLFFFNFGWGGYDNGFYSISDVNGVNGFNESQGAIFSIYPSTSNDYDVAPASVEATLDDTNYDNFTVDMSWTAPVENNKSLTGYTLYRGFEEIAQVGSDITSYTDNEGQPDNYEYSVRAIYSDGVSLCTSDYVKGKFNITIRVLDPADDSGIHMADVLFNGETTQTGFGNATFYNVPMGQGYSYVISKTGYPTTYGSLDVNQDHTYSVYMDGATNSIEELGKEFTLFPNPSNGMFNVTIPQSAVNNSSVSVVNITGKVIYSERDITNTNLTLDISSNPAGIYLLVLNMNNTNYTKTVVIK